MQKMFKVTTFSIDAKFDALDEMMNDTGELNGLNVSHMYDDGIAKR